MLHCFTYKLAPNLSTMYMLLHVNYTCNQTEFMAAGFRCRFDREARMGNDRLNSQSNSVKDAGLIFKGLQT